MDMAAVPLVHRLRQRRLTRQRDRRRRAHRETEIRSELAKACLRARLAFPRNSKENSGQVGNNNTFYCPEGNQGTRWAKFTRTYAISTTRIGISDEALSDG